MPFQNNTTLNLGFFISFEPPNAETQPKRDTTWKLLETTQLCNCRQPASCRQVQNVAIHMFRDFWALLDRNQRRQTSNVGFQGTRVPRNWIFFALSQAGRVTRFILELQPRNQPVGVGNHAPGVASPDPPVCVCRGVHVWILIACGIEPSS